MNKGLIALIAVVVIAAGGWFIYNQGKSNNTAQNTTSTTSPASSSNQPTASAGTVTMKNMMFTPSQISVKKGETVTWTNNDTVSHTVIDDLSGADGPSSGNIQPGSSYSFTFNKTGSFQYHCSIHPSMRGTIVVQ